MGIQLNGITGDAIIPGDVGIGGTLTYEDVTNVDSLGVGTFRDGLRVVGICTADEFHGNGANLTSIPAGNLTGTLPTIDGSSLTGITGLVTALSSDQTSPLNTLYYVNSVMSIGSTITVNPPPTALAVYTNYAELQLEDSADLIIESGDIVPDVLGLFVS